MTESIKHGSREHMKSIVDRHNQGDPNANQEFVNIFGNRGNKKFHLRQYNTSPSSGFVNDWHLYTLEKKTKLDRDADAARREASSNRRARDTAPGKGKSMSKKKSPIKEALEMMVNKDLEGMRAHIYATLSEKASDALENKKTEMAAKFLDQ